MCFSCEIHTGLLAEALSTGKDIAITCLQIFRQFFLELVIEPSKV
jgi:hypothetical protein